MNEPIKQHYVPKFYLKNFTTTRKDAGDLYVFDKPKAVWRTEPSTPNAEAKADYANTIYIDRRPSFMFESFLSDIETKAAPVVNRIYTTHTLPSEEKDRANLARFVASTLVRTPGHRSFARQVISMVAGKLATELDAFAQINALFEQMGIMSAGQLFSNEDMVTMIPGTTLYLAEIILRRQWQLIVADKNGAHFVTSDNPANGLLGQETRLPLGPRVAFVAADKVEAEVIEGNDKYVRVLNWMVYTNAVSFVYAHKVDDLFLHDMEELGRNPLLKPEIAYLKEALQSP